MTVNRAITETRSTGLVEKDPKTHRSRRIALDPSTVAALEAHRRLLDRRSGLTGVPIPANGYVWSPALDASRPLRPDQVSGAWRRVANRVGLGPVRFHDLRHFAATVLASSGWTSGPSPEGSATPTRPSPFAPMPTLWRRPIGTLRPSWVDSLWPHRWATGLLPFPRSSFQPESL